MSLKQKAIVAVMPIALATLGMVSAGAKPHQFSAAATYKSKCASCHGAAADKKFDPTKSDDDLLQSVLKGKKPEKPPNMPAYETKGINADHGKQLVDYMKSLRH